MIAAGDLTERVELLEAIHSDQIVGESTVQYEPVQKVWAAVRPLPARILAQFKQANMKSTIEVRIRYVDWLTMQHRVCWGGSHYSIETLVNEDNANDSWLMTCTLVENP